jgi:hypothetical protein
MARSAAAASSSGGSAIRQPARSTTSCERRDAGEGLGDAPPFPVELRALGEVLEDATAASAEGGAGRRAPLGRGRPDRDQTRPGRRALARDVFDDGGDPFAGERARDVNAPAVDLTQAGAAVVEVGAGDLQPRADVHRGPQPTGGAPIAAASLGSEMS